MTAGFLSETVKFLSVEEVAQLIKNLPAMQEIACNGLKKEMAIHSSIFACEIP